MKDPDEVGAWAQTRYDNGTVFLKFGGEGFDLMLHQIKGMLCSRYIPNTKEWSFPDTPAGHNDFARCFGNSIGDEKDRQIDEAHEGRRRRYPGEEHRAWEHQAKALGFAYELDGSILNMDMGTGKTKVALDLIRDKTTHEENYEHFGKKDGIEWVTDGRKVLVLCPKTVIPVWKRQADTHAPDLALTTLTKGTVANKTDTAKRALEDREWAEAEGIPIADRSSAVLVINYESAWREPFALWALAQEWDWVIFDEIHKIKASNGKASRFCSKLGKKAKRRLGMTGTLLPHSPQDAFGIFRTIDPGVFGTSFAKFRSRYCEMGGFQGKQVVGFTRQDEMGLLMDYITFSCAADDVLDLPDKMDITREVILTKKERQAYNDMESDMIVELNNKVLTASNGLSKLLRLQQITSGVTPAGYVDPMNVSKTDALQGVLEEIGNEPVVIFARFRADLVEAENTCILLGKNYGEVSGSRKDIEGVWEGDDIDVLGVQLQAGGLGIDLTRARHAIYMSMGFSLGDYEQSRARIHRPGQERKCVYTHLVAKDTIDEAVYKALKSKKEVIESVLDHMNHFSSMSGEEPT